jgi:ribose/xylose/arabinose/galactoside ABC-type transport system permease subunit
VGAVIAIAVRSAAASSWRTAPQFGRTVYAIGGSEQSAMLMGLPVRSTLIGVYT